jgi:hypothetical protein
MYLLSWGTMLTNGWFNFYNQGMCIYSSHSQDMDGAFFFFFFLLHGVKPPPKKV